MMRELKDVVTDTIEECINDKVTDWASLKSSIKTDLSAYLYKKTKRNPMILPVITEI